MNEHQQALEPNEEEIAQPPASEPIGRDAVAVVCQYWYDGAMDESAPWPERFMRLQQAYNHATNAYYAAKAPAAPAGEPVIPDGELSTADMLNNLAVHLGSGAVKFTDDFDAAGWIAALHRRADLLSERHPTAPLSEAQRAATLRRAVGDLQHCIADWKHASGCQTPEDLRKRLEAIDVKMAGTNEKLAELEKMIARLTAHLPL